MTAVFCDYYWEGAHRNFVSQNDDRSEAGSDISGLYHGVAALSSTDTSSQSSGTSDITEPCSPPSPETPRSCTPLPTAINGFNSSRNFCGNSNETFVVDPVSCTTYTCEKSLTFQEIAKNCRGSIYKSDGVSEQAESRLGFTVPQNEVCNASASSDKSIFNQESISNEKNDAAEFPKNENKNLAPDDNATCLSYSPKKCKHEEADPLRSKKSETTTTIITTTTTAKEEVNYAVPKDEVNQKSKQEPVSNKVSNNATKNENVICQWDKCITTMKSGFEVVEHLQNMHVASQKNSKTFSCLWSGCKVYNRTSCSLSWLERHVLAHAGSKPFQCIVDGCGQRFTSQGGLERHVNSHFNQPCSSSHIATHSGTASNPSARRKDDTPTKIMKKKRLRYRRRGWAVKTEDFFDAGTMECVQHHLVTINSKTKLDLTGSCRTVTFHSTVLARRIEGSGKVRVLLHWTPENVFPDQWILESQVESCSQWTIPLNLIPRESMAVIDPSISRNCQRLRKNRRK